MQWLSNDEVGAAMDRVGAAMNPQGGAARERGRRRGAVAGAMRGGEAVLVQGREKKRGAVAGAMRGAPVVVSQYQWLCLRMGAVAGLGRHFLLGAGAAQMSHRGGLRRLYRSVGMRVEAEEEQQCPTQHLLLRPVAGAGCCTHRSARVRLSVLCRDGMRVGWGRRQKADVTAAGMRRGMLMPTQKMVAGKAEQVRVG